MKIGGLFLKILSYIFSLNRKIDYFSLYYNLHRIIEINILKLKIIKNENSNDSLTNL